MNEIFDEQNAITTARRFLKGKLMASGLKGYVLGLSGGIDSTLSASLAVEAVGADAVYGIMMPYRSSSPESITDATLLAEKLGLEYTKIDISPMIDAYYPAITDELRLRAGNKMARERMSILFDLAAERRAMVLGTGNRTEICLGYTTWYGDAACSLNPIGEFYKTEVRQMAKTLGVPEAIITKAPSADLWKNQTDEGEIGVSYDTIDKLLALIVDQEITSMSALTAKGFDQIDISRVVSLINGNAFKRALPALAPIGRKAIPETIRIRD